jgi:adenosylmethionine-8-amino-7-oxononanoate aminotransferase
MVELRRLGVLTRLLADGALQISPPLVATRADVDALAEEIASAASAAAEPARARMRS